MPPSSYLIIRCRRNLLHFPATITNSSLFFHNFAPSEKLSNLNNNSDDPNDLINHKDWLRQPQVIRIFHNLKDPNLTFPLFHQLSKRKDYKPHESIYITVINKLATAKNYDQIDTLMDIIKLERNCPLSDAFFINVIKVYGHSAGRINRAIQTLYDMPNYNCCPTVKTFNCVLNLLVATKQFEVLPEVYAKASELRVEMDACSLNIMIKGLCECGEIDAAYKVLDEFPNQGSRTNARTFSTIMQGLCGRGRVDEALGLLERMETEEGVEVDAVVFNVLISGLRKRGRIEEVVDLYDRMMVRGCHPNSGTYQEVLYCLIDAKRFSEAKCIMGKMIDKRMNPSVQSYNALIQGFCSEGAVEDVDWTLREMVAHRIRPRIGLWQQIVQCLLQDKRAVGSYSVFFEEIISS